VGSGAEFVNKSFVENRSLHTSHIMNGDDIKTMAANLRKEISEMKNLLDKAQIQKEESKENPDLSSTLNGSRNNTLKTPLENIFERERSSVPSVIRKNQQQRDDNKSLQYEVEFLREKLKEMNQQVQQRDKDLSELQEAARKRISELNEVICTNQERIDIFEKREVGKRELEQNRDQILKKVQETVLASDSVRVALSLSEESHLQTQAELERLIAISSQFQSLEKKRQKQISDLNEQLAFANTQLSDKKVTSSALLKEQELEFHKTRTQRLEKRMTEQENELIAVVRANTEYKTALKQVKANADEKEKLLTNLLKSNTMLQEALNTTDPPPVSDGSHLHVETDEISYASPPSATSTSTSTSAVEDKENHPSVLFPQLKRQRSNTAQADNSISVSVCSLCNGGAIGLMDVCQKCGNHFHSYCLESQIGEGCPKCT